MDGVDRHAILGDQGRCGHHGLGQCFHLDRQVTAGTRD
jgi:hypothetical protein